MHEVADNSGIYMNYANPDDQIPGINPNNRVVPEISIIAYYRLPCKKIPRLMILNLVMIATKKLNLFPDKGGNLEFYSPPIILNQRNWDYKNIASMNLVHMFRQVR